MALKPTIYKYRIALSDLERDCYESLQLTVAQHPSETRERMLARALAYCLNAQTGLQFSGGGLSDPSEPDLFVPDANGNYLLWIDVGEPEPERLKKACRRSEQVKVYSFNAKSNVWWSQHRAKLTNLPLAVHQLDWTSLTAVAASVDRTMDLSIMVSGAEIHIVDAGGDYRVQCVALD